MTFWDEASDFLDDLNRKTNFCRNFPDNRYGSATPAPYNSRQQAVHDIEIQDAHSNDLCG